LTAAYTLVSAIATTRSPYSCIPQMHSAHEHCTYNNSLLCMRALICPHVLI
jgi:hypothetical protein